MTVPAARRSPGGATVEGFAPLVGAVGPAVGVKAAGVPVAH